MVAENGLPAHVRISVQVAYELEDSLIEEWVDAVAERVTQGSALRNVEDPPGEDTDDSHGGEYYYKWPTSPRLYKGFNRDHLQQDFSRDVQQGMACLSVSLRLRVFSAAAKMDMSSALQFASDHLPPAALAEVVAPQKEVKHVFSRDTSSMLAAIHTIPASPPSLLSLHASFQSSGSPDAQKVTNLCSVLRHHKHLTALNLVQCGVDASAAQLLAPAVSALSSLLSLSLGSPSHPDTCEDSFQCDTIPLWQAALHALPQLQSLTLHLAPAAVASRSPPAKKRRRQDRSKSAKTPPDKVFYLRSLLLRSTNLTSLTLQLGTAKPDAYIDELAPLQLCATKTLHLPHLSDLQLTGSCHRSAGRFLSHLVAPITSLKLTHYSHSHVSPAQQAQPPTGSASPPAASDQARRERNPLQSLPSFQELRKVHLDLRDCWQDYREEDEEEGVAALTARRAAATAAASAALVQLPHLTELHLGGAPEVLYGAVPDVVRRVAQLRTLHMQCRFKPDAAEPSTPRWLELLGAVAEAQLHDLRLCMACRDEFSETSRARALPGLGTALAPLTQLTCLVVTGYRNCFRGGGFGGALAGMTRLCHLVIDDFRIAAGSGGEVLVQDLQPLHALTQLGLTGGMPGRGFVDAFVAAAASWPQLQRLSLGAEGLGRTRTTLEDAAPRLASLKQLRFCTGTAEAGMRDDCLDSPVSRRLSADLDEDQLLVSDDAYPVVWQFESGTAQLEVRWPPDIDGPVDF